MAGDSSNSGDEEKEKDKSRAIILLVDELRRHYDTITNSFDHLRSKALGLLGGEIAIITFLFAVNPEGVGFNISIISNFIFFSVGVVSMIASLILLIGVLSSASWGHPPDTKMSRHMSSRIGDTSIKVLLYLKGEYEDLIDRCIGTINVRARRFMWAVYSFILASFILVVLKYGGGGIKL